MKELTVEEIVERRGSLDKAIKKWLRANKMALRIKIATRDMHQKAELFFPETNLEKELKSKTKKFEGFYEYVGFSFLLHGFFLEHGTGKGRKAGTAKARRNAKPWLAPVLGPASIQLADLLQEEYGDILESIILSDIPEIINLENGE